MKITKKIIRIGDSLGVLLDKQILDKIKLKKGDFIELDMKKVEL